MLYGISGAPVPDAFPLAPYFNEWTSVPPLLIAAIAWRETLSVMPSEAARTFISDDGGHGVMQLTSSFPEPGWDSFETNIDFACDNFLGPALDYWGHLHGYGGDALIRLVAATYNAGLGNAIKGHAAGNVDLYTTNNYAAGVLAIFTSLRTTPSHT